MTDRLYRQIIFYLFLLSIMSCILCACGSVNSSPSENAAEQATAESTSDADTSYNRNPEELKLSSQEYNLYFGGSTTIRFNALGKLCSETDPYITAIKDLKTKETDFYSVCKKIISRKADGSCDITYRSRLYDVSGRLLIDWDNVQYFDAFGGWVLSQEYPKNPSYEMSQDAEGKLLKVKTKETIDGISRVQALEDCFAADNYDSILYTLDADGNILYDFSSLKKTLGDTIEIYPYQNYIVADQRKTDSTLYYFYSSKGEYLGFLEGDADSYLYNDSVQKPYVFLNFAIYDPSQGHGEELKPIAVYDDEINYYDSTVTIRKRKLSEDSREQALYDSKSGRQLSSTYDSIYEEFHDEVDKIDREASCFFGVKGSHIDKLSRKGQILAQADIENLCGIALYRNGLKCSTDDWSRDLLLDPDLNEIPTSKPYVSIYPLTDQDKSSKTNFWAAMYSLDSGRDRFRYDLLNSDGKILMDGLSAIEDIHYNKIAVVRGQSFGLIDLNGSWFVKFSKINLSDMD